MTRRGEDALNIFDLREMAKRRLPKWLFEFVDRGTEEEVAEKVGGTLWMQLYMWADRRLSHQIVRRAAAAGFEALLVTVDGVVAGNREYNKRNGFQIPFKYNSRNTTDVLMHPGWMLRVLGRYIANGGMPTRANFPEELRTNTTRD